MNLKLEDYVIKLDSFIDKKFCKKLILELKKNKSWKDHLFHDTKTDKKFKISKNKELEVCYLQGKLHDDLMVIFWNAINEYINKKIKLPWFNSWNGYSSIRYNKYSKNKKMAFHCDHIHSVFDGTIKGIPILSILAVLNEDYEGGEFVMFKDKKIKTKTGDIIIFPSVFLYPHGVEPVTKGTRYSCISWVY
jgi:hypothetical protein